MTVDFNFRPGRVGDVERIVQVHHAAIRGMAASFYDSAIIAAWAPEPIPPSSIRQLADRMGSGEERVIVAVNENDCIVGFGSIVPDMSELRAVYVAPTHVRRGIGTQVLHRLEALAGAANLAELRVNASINAEAFYLFNGYLALEWGEHVLGSGQRMACIRMQKLLA